MYELGIRCPTTGLPVETGELAPGRPDPQSTVNKTLVGCPACGKIHAWQMRDAWPIRAVRAAGDDDDHELL